MDTRIFCYRPDGTCYAIISAAVWKELRKGGKLDAVLKRMRELGEVFEAKRDDSKTYKPASHFKPRGDTTLVIEVDRSGGQNPWRGAGPDSRRDGGGS